MGHVRSLQLYKMYNSFLKFLMNNHSNNVAYNFLKTLAVINGLCLYFTIVENVQKDRFYKSFGATKLPICAISYAFFATKFCQF